MLREKRKLEPEIEKNITEVVGEYIKSLMGRRKKETPDVLDEYTDQPQAVASKTE